MSLSFHPKPAMILMCNFNTGFQPPEMVKNRPIVVVSPRPRRSNQLCTVVPLSTVKPDPMMPHHHRLDSKSLPGRLAEYETWAKCDMVATVSLKRLDRVRVKDNCGKRSYVSKVILPEDFRAILQGILAALGLHGLTVSL